MLIIIVLLFVVNVRQIKVRQEERSIDKLKNQYNSLKVETEYLINPSLLTLVVQPQNPLKLYYFISHCVIRSLV